MIPDNILKNIVISRCLKSQVELKKKLRFKNPMCELFKVNVYLEEQNKHGYICCRCPMVDRSECLFRYPSSIGINMLVRDVLSLIVKTINECDSVRSKEFKDVYKLHVNNRRSLGGKYVAQIEKY